MTKLAHLLGGVATSASLGAIGGCYAADENPQVNADGYAAVETAEDAYESDSSARPVGDFQVRLMAPDAASGRPGATDVVGTITDGPEPEPIAWHTTAEDGACALLEPEAPFCQTACSAWSVCTADDTCTPYPQHAELGAVYLSGISEQELELTRVNGTYSAGNASLEFAPCAEGDAIRLRTNGGPDASFTRETRCIAPLEVDELAPLEPGHDQALTWARPADPERSRIRVRLDLNHRGGSKAAIACEADDDGKLTIASALTDGLLAHGSAGLPMITVTRTSRSAPDTEPQGVTLSMLHTVERRLAMAGAIH